MARNARCAPSTTRPAGRRTVGPISSSSKQFVAFSDLRHSLAWIAAGGLLLAGCATPQPYQGSPQDLSPEERRLQALENRVADLQRRVDGIQSTTNVSDLEQQQRDLRGQVQELQHQQQMEQQQLQQTLQAYDQRLQRLESGGAQPAAASTAVAPASAAAAAANSQNPLLPPGPAGVDSAAGAEESLYLSNFNQLKAGNLDAAIKGFRDQLARYPQGNEADNAWYWLGESYYVQRAFQKALDSFNALVTNFPVSPKVPDALLETGRVYKDSKRPQQARTVWQQLIQRYPNSDAATSARQLLARPH
ncbi:MAG: tol-pal system protein YbgF [Gammaproteobacteria bacterium]|nr:tol-pal system protein YbgF [Gammaproteobacteria bacterium]